MGAIMFYHFVNHNYGMHCKDGKKKDTPYGDFAMDMVSDHDFPWIHSLSNPARLIEYHDQVLEHLNKNHACNGAIKAFEELFGMYFVSVYIEQYKERKLKRKMHTEKYKKRKENDQ